MNVCKKIGSIGGKEMQGYRGQQEEGIGTGRKGKDKTLKGSGGGQGNTPNTPKGESPLNSHTYRYNTCT